MVNSCMKEVKKRKSIILARFSPRHSRLPTRQEGRKSSRHFLLRRFFRGIIFFLTSWERDEGSPLPELPLLVQKVSWVEGEWRLPLVLVEQRWGQISDDSRSLVIRIKTVTNSLWHKSDATVRRGPWGWCILPAGGLGRSRGAGWEEPHCPSAVTRGWPRWCTACWHNHPWSPVWTVQSPRLSQPGLFLRIKDRKGAGE